MNVEVSSPEDTPFSFVSLTSRNVTSKQANNSSILVNNSSSNSNLGSGGNYNCSSTGSPKRAYTLRQSVVNGIILHNLKQKLTESGNSSEQKSNDEADSDFVLYRTASNNNKKMKRDCNNEEENEDIADGSTLKALVWMCIARL